MIAALAGCGGLFLWSFLAATVLPLSSEAPLAAFVHAWGWVAVPVAVATVGNTLGACTTYWLGRKARQLAGRPTAELTPRRRRAEEMVRRYGAPVLLLSWVPILGDALVAVAGAMEMPIGRFVGWAVVGKAARYVAVAWAVSSWA